MHQHLNDEILSYLWRGAMIHEDSDGYRVELSSRAAHDDERRQRLLA
jgi:quercetin 2,3-dioxygenase